MRERDRISNPRVLHVKRRNVLDGVNKFKTRVFFHRQPVLRPLRLDSFIALRAGFMRAPLLFADRTPRFLCRPGATIPLGECKVLEAAILRFSALKYKNIPDEKKKKTASREIDREWIKFADMMSVASSNCFDSHLLFHAVTH